VKMRKESGDKRRPKLGWKKKLLLICLGLLFGLFIMEIALRIIGYTYPIWYMPDEHTGYSLRPSVEGWYTREGQSYVRVNSDGLRDREHSKQKPANTVRIAILGDSFSEAMHVPQEETFWWLMERKLKECPQFAGKQVEVINFGVSGYGTAQELITLRQKVWDYQPDIVLLAFLTFNDIMDNSKTLKDTEEMPYFVYRDGQLVEDKSFLTSRTYTKLTSPWNRLGRWIRDRVRVFQAVHHAAFVYKTYMEARRARQVMEAQNAEAQKRQAEAKQPTGPEQPRRPTLVNHWVYYEPKDPVWQDAWRVTEGLIAEMSREVKERGAQFVVIVLDNDVQSLPNPKSRENFMRSIGVTDLSYPNRRVEEFCKSQGIQVLDIAPMMLEYAERNNVLLHGFGKDIGNGHWNSAGHAQAAELMTRKVCQMQSGR
ncbi:MAG TPA: SGNH/GDSL hydrolase family protein, partial [Pyrinomonadaceae bacterium]|nr:SGNH/GDSL hydrolase family protein [Pyrinomonadaceae bacterium]